MGTLSLSLLVLLCYFKKESMSEQQTSCSFFQDCLTVSCGIPRWKFPVPEDESTSPICPESFLKAVGIGLQNCFMEIVWHTKFKVTAPAGLRRLVPVALQPVWT